MPLAGPAAAFHAPDTCWSVTAAVGRNLKIRLKKKKKTKQLHLKCFFSSDRVNIISVTWFRRHFSRDLAQNLSVKTDPVALTKGCAEAVSLCFEEKVRLYFHNCPLVVLSISII